MRLLVVLPELNIFRIMIKPNTLIIGGSSIFGKTIAKELLLSNHNLIISFLNKDNKDMFAELIKLSKVTGNTLNIEKLDILDETQIKKIIENNVIKFNNLIYSVGIPIEFRSIDRDDLDNLERQLHIHISGLWSVVNKLIKEKHPLKSILVVGSSCLFGIPPSRLSSYTIGKYGQLGLVRCLANELAPKGIRVNMISPGVSGDGLSSIYPDAFLKLIKSQTPLKRLVNGKDIACLAKFLLSDEAEYLTGLNIPVDGGLHII